MLDNWDKGNKNTESNTVEKAGTEYIQTMGKAMDVLCETLSKESKEFVAKSFFDDVHKYILEKDRLLYTQMTNYIFTLSDEKFGILQTNLDSVVNYMYSEQYKLDFEAELKFGGKRKALERTQRTVLKMWDHINLARKQHIMFHHKDEDYTKIVEEKMEVASAKLSKEMNGQLIGLVSIFTALSFLVFGGVSSLDNILSGAQNIPILKLVIVGSVWCFCVMNMMYIFLYFIARITGLSLAVTDDVNANVIKKYPLICWSNLVVIAIFLLSSWALYIYSQNLSVQLYEWIYEKQTAFFIAGTIAIIALICYAMKKLINSIK